MRTGLSRERMSECFEHNVLCQVAQTVALANNEWFTSVCKGSPYAETATTGTAEQGENQTEHCNKAQRPR